MHELNIILLVKHESKGNATESKGLLSPDGGVAGWVGGGGGVAARQKF